MKGNYSEVEIKQLLRLFIIFGVEFNALDITAKEFVRPMGLNLVHLKFMWYILYNKQIITSSMVRQKTCLISKIFEQFVATPEQNLCITGNCGAFPNALQNYKNLKKYDQIKGCSFIFIQDQLSQILTNYESVSDFFNLIKSFVIF